MRSPSYPTGSAWSRRPPCPSTAWPPPRPSTCSARRRAAPCSSPEPPGPSAGYALRLATAAGWSVTGLARAADEDFVRGSGAELIITPTGSFDAVLDAARLDTAAIALVRDGGSYVGTRPGGGPASERGITTAAVETDPDARVLADLLARTASGELPARVHAVLPLDRAADAHRALAKGGVRGRYVLRP